MSYKSTFVYANAFILKEILFFFILYKSLMAFLFSKALYFRPFFIFLFSSMIIYLIIVFIRFTIKWKISFFFIIIQFFFFSFFNYTFICRFYF